MKLLFVCSGNTCRSPLATAAWRAVVADWREADAEAAQVLEDFEARSVGLSPSVGSFAALHAQRIAAQWGEDLSIHRACMFQPQHATSDMIVTMTADQAAVIRAHFRVPEPRIQLLGAFAPREKCLESAQLGPLLAGIASPDWPADSLDILDPYGGSFEAYQACANRIRRCVEGLACHLANFWT